MEDSFSVRVDKIFGSLDTGKNPASSDGAHSLWRLTDEEVEGQKWNRRKDRQQEEEEDNELRQSAFVNPKPNVEGDDEDEEEVEEIDGAKSKRRRNNVNKSAAAVADEDDWNVGAIIGRDCTLDYEDEEDEYDKVAIGSEQNSDRLYMKDVKSTDDQVNELNAYDYLRDPSKYTCYSIDCGYEAYMNDNSNKEAYMNYFQYLRKPNTVYSSEGDTSVDEPKSVRFTSKNKREGESLVKRNEREDRENRENKGWSIGVTAEITQEHEAFSMEEDRPYVADDSSSSFQKPSRQYRARN